MTQPPFLSNFEEPREQREQANQYLGKRRLVEECQIIWVYALQQAVGKKTLVAAIREGRPFRVSVPGGYYDVWLVYEPHRLLGKPERWSSLEDGNARLWLWCPGCHRRIAKLYYFFFSGSLHRSDLLCRHCHRLTYQSINCGGSRWWKEVVPPMKRLLREKERLLGKRYSPLVRARLIELNGQIRILHEQVKPKRQDRRRRLSYRPESRQRRRYRDLSLLDQ